MKMMILTLRLFIRRAYREVHHGLIFVFDLIYFVKKSLKALYIYIYIYIYKMSVIRPGSRIKSLRVLLKLGSSHIYIYIIYIYILASFYLAILIL